MKGHRLKRPGEPSSRSEQHSPRSPKCRYWALHLDTRVCQAAALVPSYSPWTVALSVHLLGIEHVTGVVPSVSMSRFSDGRWCEEGLIA